MQKEKWMVKSQDSFQKNLEVVEMEVEEKESVLYYRYESKLGPCQVHFESKKNRIVLQRGGAEEIQLELLVDEKTEMQYQNSLYRDTFLVEGISCKGDLNFLEFSYRLLEKTGEPMNEIRIQMKRRM